MCSYYLETYAIQRNFYTLKKLDDINHIQVQMQKSKFQRTKVHK